jgi:hypothetical protein
MGSFPYQKSAGKFMNELLYENVVKTLAKNISRDITYLGWLFSSTYEVGAGKSVLAQQIGEAYTEEVNRIHNLNLTFSIKNIVFNPEDLITRCFELPKYSCVILDEWDDAHYWSKLGLTLRKFFRKCRQLNQFVICIIPNWFECPRSYALSRSLFAIDVKFKGEFERGYFDFYNFDKKKDLYIKGKKEMNYKVTFPNFDGRFPNGYGVDEATYRRVKYLDMLKFEEKEKPEVTEKQIKINLFKQLHQNLPKISVRELAIAFGTTKTTAYRWINEENEDDYEPPSCSVPTVPQQFNIPINKKNFLGGGQEGEEEANEKEDL